LLNKSNIDFNARNNDNKTPYELQSDKEIKKLFEIFVSEKKKLNQKMVERVPIHTTQSENINKMFENNRTNQEKPGVMNYYNKIPLGNNLNYSNLPNVLPLNKTLSDNSTNRHRTSPIVSSYLYSLSLFINNMIFRINQ